MGSFLTTHKSNNTTDNNTNNIKEPFTLWDEENDRPRNVNEVMNVLIDMFTMYAEEQEVRMEMEKEMAKFHEFRHEIIVGMITKLESRRAILIKAESKENMKQMFDNLIDELQADNASCSTKSSKWKECIERLQKIEDNYNAKRIKRPRLTTNY